MPSLRMFEKGVAFLHSGRGACNIFVECPCSHALFRLILGRMVGSVLLVLQMLSRKYEIRDGSVMD